MNVHPNSPAARDIAYYFHPSTNARRHETVGPMIIERGQGVYVYDDQGKQYIEGLAGLWSVAVGFGEERRFFSLFRTHRRQDICSHTTERGPFWKSVAKRSAFAFFYDM